MSHRHGVQDPDDWYNRWQALHRSESFPSHLIALTFQTLEDPLVSDGVGRTTLTFEEADHRTIVVEVAYLVETFPTGRVFHILKIRSPGDPGPPDEK